MLPSYLKHFTHEQLAALSTDRWLSIKASAGTGKTAVLTARFVLLLEQGVPLDAIVAITFTRKAAREISARVAALLHQRIHELRQDSGESNSKKLATLEKARSRFHLNRIGTIDSFCSTLISQYALEIGVEPGFAVLDQDAAYEARGRAVDRLIRESSARHTRGDDDELTQAFVNVNDWLSSNALRRLLHTMCQQRYNLQQVFSHWNNFSDIKDRERYLAALSTQSSRLFEQFVEEHNMLRRLEEAQAAASQVAPHLKPDDARLEVIRLLGQALQEGSHNVSFPPLSGRAHKVWAEAGYDAKHLTQLKNDYEALSKLCHFDTAYEEQAIHVLASLAMLLPLLTDLYTQEKRRSLDFDDLKLHVADLLGNQSIRRSCADAISYLMVDEFQDTDPLQWSILSSLVGEQKTNLFIVGDDKQSIYRFRGADVSVFQRASNLIRQRNTQFGLTALRNPYTGSTLNLEEQGNAGADGVITLSHNFRSSPLLVESGNRLFDRIFKIQNASLEQARELKDFDARSSAMQCGRKEAGATSIAFLPFAPKPSSFDDDTTHGQLELSASEYEARLTAKQILALRDTHSLAFDEIAVLVPTHRSIPVLQMVFAHYGIPYAISGGKALFKQQETHDLLNLLGVLANSHDDLAMLGYLRSSLSSIDDNTLALLVRNDELAHGKRRALYEILRDHGSWPAELSDIQRALLASSLNRLEEHRLRASKQALRDLLFSALSDAGYWAHCTSAARSQRNANVERLLELAAAFEAEHGPDPASFALWLRKRIKEQSDESEGTPDEAHAGVNVMTIHASKGKEFEAVVLPFLHHGNHSRGDTLAWQRSYEQEPLASLRLQANTTSIDPDYRPLAARLIDQLERQQQNAEYRRLLYVAWTRAKQHLSIPLKIKPSKKVLFAETDGSTLSMQDALTCALGLPKSSDLEGFSLPLEEARKVLGNAGSMSIHDLHLPETIEIESTDQLRDQLKELEKYTNDKGYGFDETLYALTRPIPQVETSELEATSVSMRSLEQERTIGHLPKEKSKHPAVPQGSRQIGNIVHEAMRHYGRGARKHAPEQLVELGTLLHAPLSQLPQKDKQSAAAHVARAIGLLDKLPSRVLCEKSFSLVLGTRTLRRTLDLAYEVEAGIWHVIDYKTGQDSPAYERQLKEYALGLWKLLERSGKQAKRIEMKLLMSGDARLIDKGSLEHDSLKALEADLSVDSEAALSESTR